MVFGPMTAVAFALAAAAPFQAAGTDRLVDAGGVKLHIRCDGERAAGAPLVVLEAGAGNSAKTWNDVFAPIAQFARVCAYDRVGMGTSEKAPKVPTFTSSVEMLHALLRAADERPPYVMAGHSYGGAMARFFATRYPGEVAGLVLVDSSHEDQVNRFAALQRAIAPAAPARAAGPPGETIDLQGMAEEMGRAPWRANIPLVVLTHTAPPVNPNSDAREDIWIELQRELATRSPQSEHIVAPKSGHYIQNDEPPLVIEAIRRVIANATRPRI